LPFSSRLAIDELADMPLLLSFFSTLIAAIFFAISGFFFFGWFHFHFSYAIAADIRRFSLMTPIDSCRQRRFADTVFAASSRRYITPVMPDISPPQIFAAAGFHARH
jgi:hypothetical protein